MAILSKFRRYSLRMEENYWWAWQDLNLRPPGYQPGAPAKLSYTPLSNLRTSIPILNMPIEHYSDLIVNRRSHEGLTSRAVYSCRL